MKSDHPDFRAVDELSNNIARLTNWGAREFTYRNPDGSNRLVIESPEDKVRKAVAIAGMKEALGNLIGCSGVWTSYLHELDVQEGAEEVFREILDPEEQEIFFGLFYIGDTASGI